MSIAWFCPTNSCSRELSHFPSENRSFTFNEQSRTSSPLSSKFCGPVQWSYQKLEEPSWIRHKELCKTIGKTYKIPLKNQDWDDNTFTVYSDCFLIYLATKKSAQDEPPSNNFQANLVNKDFWTSPKSRKPKPPSSTGKQIFFYDTHFCRLSPSAAFQRKEETIRFN